MRNLLSRLLGVGGEKRASVRQAPVELPTILVFDPDKPEPSLERPVSQSCTRAQLDEPAFMRWCREIGEEPRLHRKQWEFCYILQALHGNGMMAEGRRGLAFGVGIEPLVALVADYGASVLATDLDPRRAHQAGWVETAQHAENKQALNGRALCDPARFDALVDFRYMDMNAIDPDLAGQFDFCWSACAFEHLGSIRAGLDFVRRSIDCLKPGGLAIHTTELNCSSDTDTLARGATVLFRRSDFLALGEELRAQGHGIEFNFNLGDEPLDHHIDIAPFRQDEHLKLQLERWVTTSFGLIVRKAGPPAP